MNSDFLYSFIANDGAVVIRERTPDIPNSVHPVELCADNEVKTFTDLINTAYEDIVQWRKNLFEVPTCAVGRRFVKELAVWLQHFNTTTKFKHIAIKAFIVLPAILLQKPSAKSKNAEHKKLLSTRLDLWDKREISELLRSGKSIQKRLLASTRKKKDAARTFANLVFEGRITAAVRMLNNEDNNGVLPLSDETLSELKLKHPIPAGIRDHTLLNGPVRKFDSQYFDGINGNMIERAAKMTNGAAGPSTTDAEFFRRILVHKNFKGSGQDLRDEVATFAQKIASEYLDPLSLDAYVNCRLIPLDKCPGVRPIGIGETIRRIVGKAIAWSLKADIQDTAGPLQVCTGIKSGAEAAIHFVREQFESEAAEACIMVDASNAFNAVNRHVMLHNLQRQCPEFAPIAINMYRNTSRLFVSGSEIISQEGTTQGDNLAMHLFAMATLPILQFLERSNSAFQVWLADDATAVGTLEGLRTWWDGIVREGIKYGYHVNAGKSCLILKNCDDHERALSIFNKSGIKLKVTGQRHLGAVVGSQEFKDEYMNKLIDDWTNMIKMLSEYGQTQPHASYSAFILGVRHKMTYFMRTMEELGDKLVEVDKVLDEKLIPALFGCPVSQLERRILSMPVRFGGLGIPVLSQLAKEEYKASSAVTRELIDAMKGTESENQGDLKKIVDERKKMQEQEYQTILAECDTKLARALEQAKEKGSSNWLTVIPLRKYGFSLTKSEFRDSLLLRYGKDLPRLPKTCACGTDMTINHALNCARGGYVIIRHNAIRDFLAEKLSEVCSDVQIEPQLQPLEGEVFSTRTVLTGEHARPDIRARGFYRRGQQSFFDIKMLNPNSDSYAALATKKVYEQAERKKRALYNERILEVEHGTFAPLIFSVTGGAGPETQVFIKILCDKITRKNNQSYPCVVNFIKCKLAFLIRKLVLLCVRGTRVTKKMNNECSESDYEYGCFVSKIGF